MGLARHLNHISVWSFLFFGVTFGVSGVVLSTGAVIPPLLGAGGPAKFTIAVTDADSAPVAAAARANAKGFDAELKVRRLSPAAASKALSSGDVDAVLSSGGRRAKEEPDDKLTGMIDTAARQVHQTDALRAAGLLEVYTQAGMEYLDPWTSRAFAVADHQVAHVYVRDPADLDRTRAGITELTGVDEVLDHAGKAK